MARTNVLGEFGEHSIISYVAMIGGARRGKGKRTMVFGATASARRVCLWGLGGEPWRGDRGIGLVQGDR